MSEDRRQPFLKRAQGKSSEDRTFFEKIAVGIYGEEKELLPDLQLDENFEDLILSLIHISSPRDGLLSRMPSSA